MSKRQHTREAQTNRTEFFEQGKLLDADPATRQLANCWICSLRIDYDVDPGSTDDSHNLDHFFPVSTHPELQNEPTNWRHSHRRCNIERGDGSREFLDLGEQVPAWWL